MTTASSPIQILKAQAEKIARGVKATGLDAVRAGVVMDDKILVLDLTGVLETSEKALVGTILDLMQMEL